MSETQRLNLAFGEKSVCETPLNIRVFQRNHIRAFVRGQYVDKSDKSV